MVGIERKIRDITSKLSYSTCGISYEVLKKKITIMKKPILDMTNKSVELGHYPDPSKHGLMKPLFKGGTTEKDDPESYRPVNILPGPGRIMDMCTSEQQTNLRNR